jgi:phage baseplate assembly protein W
MAFQEPNFLGKGWKFPPTFSKTSASAVMSSGVKDVEESLTVLLSTFPGERLMQPKYGCDLKKFVFEQIDATLISELNDEIAHAILHFEPRVKFIEAEVIEKNELEGIASLLIKYEIIITNTRHNIVFPFYKLEGTNIDNALL